VVDRRGGVYFTDLTVSAQKVAVYYLSAQGTVTRLLESVPWAKGIRLAPDEKTLYLLAHASPEVWAYPLEGAGLIGKGKSLCKLQQKAAGPARGNDMSSDSLGNLYVANGAAGAVQVVTPEGGTLGSFAVPETPTHSALGGRDMKTLFIRTATALYTVRIEVTRPVQSD
jgi:gluconolactonase